MRKYIALPLLLAFAIFGCSKPDTTLLQDGIAAEEKGDNTKAMECYQKLVDEFPDGDGAPEAMYRLAALHQSYKHDPLKAATLYENIIVKYPKSPWAHKGLFLAGFTYNNDLGNRARAEKVYRKYLEVYPDSSWAKDVQFELDNLGKSPDEVLQSLRDTLQEPPAQPVETFE